MDKVVVLSTLKFTETQLNKFRAVSPRLDVQQITDARAEDVPDPLRNQVEILYGWSKPAEQAHLYPNLRWLQVHSAGINNLFNTPVWQSDTKISSMNGVHSIQMAEHALAMMLAFRWKLRTMFRLQQSATWPEDRGHLFKMPELRGSTIGIVGYGAIGRELARQARALGMQVVAVNRSGQRRPYQGYAEPGTGDPDTTIPHKLYATDNLLQMLPMCDYVVLLAPFTPQTYHLFDGQTFAHMKPSAFFFNLSRGPLVDENALLNALKQGQIAGAGLDVFEQEPLPSESLLWKLDNVIISPHISGLSAKYDERASNLFAENLQRYLAGGRLINQVNRERSY